MVETSSAPSRRPTAGASAILLALAVFAGLWLLNAPYRQAYQPSHDDVTALADGLLLLPGAQWTDWFTQGHTRFFIPYPEWSIAQTGFARPVYQATIYLAHFVLDRHWSSYLAINYLALAGIAAVGFAIARRVLACAQAKHSLRPRWFCSPRRSANSRSGFWGPAANRSPAFLSAAPSSRLSVDAAFCACSSCSQLCSQRRQHFGRRSRRPRQCYGIEAICDRVRAKLGWGPCFSQ
jgi:hypothetical protein